MAEPDELLARADEHLWAFEDDEELATELAAALRAALAARPQADELERLRNCVKWAAEMLPCTEYERDLLRAVAGPPAPTGDDDG